MNAQITRPAGAPNPGQLEVKIRDKETLYGMYMPFLKNGGLFISLPRNFTPLSPDEFALGEDIFVLLTLMDSSTEPTSGLVVWQTPHNAEGNRLPGFGIHFTEPSEEAGTMRKKIEGLIAGSHESGRPTYTM